MFDIISDLASLKTRLSDTQGYTANSANGSGREILDLSVDNMQLKKELQKMVTQIERLKSYAMSKNDPHLTKQSPRQTLLLEKRKTSRHSDSRVER